MLHSTVLYSSALTVIAVCNLQKPDSSLAAVAGFMAAAQLYVCNCTAVLQCVLVCGSITAFCLFV